MHNFVIDITGKVNDPDVVNKVREAVHATVQGLDLDPQTDGCIVVSMAAGKPFHVFHTSIRLAIKTALHMRKH